MASPPSLPAALLHRAAADPEEPWLFRAEGWDWVWHSWGELARWMEGWTERLSALPAGTRTAFSYAPRPESVVLDLAIQGAGLVSVPGERRGDGFWVEIADGQIESSPPIPLSHRPPPSPERGDLAGAMVTVAGETVEWTDAEIVAAGERLRGEIGETGEREIVVLGGPLEDPAERTMMAWATLAGAAVVLEPDPALRAATAAWVRPTVFHGTPAEIAELRRRVGKRRGRLPFRRLRTLLVMGPEAMPVEDEAFWRGRGVKVARAFAAERRNRGI